MQCLNYLTVVLKMEKNNNKIIDNNNNINQNSFPNFLRNFSFTIHLFYFSHPFSIFLLYSSLFIFIFVSTGLFLQILHLSLSIFPLWSLANLPACKNRQKKKNKKKNQKIYYQSSTILYIGSFRYTHIYNGLNPASSGQAHKLPQAYPDLHHPLLAHLRF